MRQRCDPPTPPLSAYHASITQFGTRKLREMTEQNPEHAIEVVFYIVARMPNPNSSNGKEMEFQSKDVPSELARA